MHAIPVVDLSHWNPEPDWNAMAAAGIVGVIHKATESTNYTDPTLFSRMKRAKAAGLLTSTYHFLRPGNMEQQMGYYLGTVDPVQGERVCLDHEDSGVTVGNLQDAVQAILMLRPDLQIAIYSGHLIKDQLGNGVSTILKDNTSLWIAHYTSAASPSWPSNTWAAWSLWQFTDKASVPGCPKPVDGDRWNGDEAGLRKWLSPANGPQPAPTPEPETDVIYVDVNIGPVPVGVTVKVRVNGEET